jgi:hypothetical protein
MNNTKFWGAGSAPTQPDGKPANGNGKKFRLPKMPKLGKMGDPSMPKKGLSSKHKKILGGIGVAGVVLALIGVAAAGLIYMQIVRPVITLIASTNIVKEDVALIGEAIRSRDLVELAQVTDKTEEDLKEIRKDRDSTVGWMKGKTIFKLGEFYSDSDRFIDAGLMSLDAVREMSNIVVPFADAAGLKVEADQEIEETEGLLEAFQSWVNLMPQVADQMDPVIAKLDEIGGILEPVNVEKYPEHFRGIAVRDTIALAKNTLSNAGEYAPDIKLALQVFPGILGVDTPTKRYMIIMQNDKEIRPTGGFMTNYATFRMANGLLMNNDFSSKDMYSVDLTLDIIDATYDFPDAPEAYMKYLKVERWYARDMNASPDLINSMDQFLVFYNMAGRLSPYEHKPIDGIITIDTWVIEELLEVTGPVTVNGITYDSKNVVLELEKMASLALREQAGRKRVLGYLMNAMLKNIFESTDKDLWPRLIDKGVSLGIRKHVQAYMFEPEAQALIEKYGFGGRVLDETQAPGDYSMVVSTNLGGDKTNWFVSKVVDHKLEREGDRYVRTVKINYTYNEPTAEYAPFLTRFRDWVRVYMPAGSELISVEGSADGSLSGEERTRVWHSAYIELGPNESTEVTFKYYVPDTVVQDGKYMLTLQKQAGIDREMHRVDVMGNTKEHDLFMDTTLTFGL